MTPLNDKALEEAARAIYDEWTAEPARKLEELPPHMQERLRVYARAAVTAYLKTHGSGWCADMSVAPRDRDTKIDLWLMSRRTGRQLGRMTDCYWGRGWQQDGKFICGKWYVDNDGDNCLDPLCEDKESIVATHWRPLPEPPGGKGD